MLPPPPDTFTKAARPERAEVPAAPPRTDQEITDFLMDRLPDQGSPEANQALRDRLALEFQNTMPVQEHVQSETRRLLSHRLDDPRQDISNPHNLQRALENATPEEADEFLFMLARHMAPLQVRAMQLLETLNPESQAAFLSAQQEFAQMQANRFPPSYQDVFPLPRYDELPTPAYGEHEADQLLDRAMPGTFPEQDIPAEELLRPFKNWGIPTSVKEGFVNLIERFH